MRGVAGRGAHVGNDPYLKPNTKSLTLSLGLKVSNTGDATASGRGAASLCLHILQMNYSLNSLKKAISGNSMGVTRATVGV